MISRFRFLAMIFLLFGTAAYVAAQSSISLDGADWKMRDYRTGSGEKTGVMTAAFDESSFRTVTVPGDTQLQAGFTDLSRFRPTPALLHVNRSEWWYRKHFRFGNLPRDGAVELAFDGVDYFASVWLNGKFLGSHEGTYTTFRFDVTTLLRPDADNVLAIRVTHPPIPPDGRSMEGLMNGGFSMATPWANAPLQSPPYFTEVHWDALPSGGNATFAMGIWRSVHLETEPRVLVRDVHVATTAINSDGSASLRFDVTVVNHGNTPKPVAVAVKLSPANFSGADPVPLTLRGEARPGETVLTQNYSLKSARLWWSWDQGPQNLYSLTATVHPEDARSTTFQTRFGIRTVSQDPVDLSFRLNGRRIFTKGTHFPIEDFYRSTPTHNDYERDLLLLRAANFNSVVNFTVVEKHDFYDLCDELGILVIAQMPFSQFGPMQILEPDNPRKQAFLSLAHDTARNFILQLRSHPSVVEWAPLAEAHDKAEKGRWGANGFQWNQQGYDEFIANIQSLVEELAPGDVFHASLCDFGEQHFWMGAAGVGPPDSSYQEHFDATAHSVSEFGGISMSSYENLSRYLDREQIWGTPNQARWFHLPIDYAAYAYWTSLEYDGLWSMLWRAHHGVDRHPHSARDLVADTQTWQAFLMSYAANSYRRHKYEPIMGLRSWCFLELAPGFRFGIVDYDRVPKPAYYALRHAQAPVLVSLGFRDALAGQIAGRPWSAPLHVINDTQLPLSGTLRVQLLDLQGNARETKTFPVQVPSDSRAVAGEFSTTLPSKPGIYVVRSELTDSSAQTIAVDRSYLKVVDPLSSAPLRVLLIGQKAYSEPIAAVLKNLGAEVTTLDEDALLHAGPEFSDAASLHARYDVIWLSRFDWLGKLIPASLDHALSEAVRLGTGLVHTGGKGSFHGGWLHSSVLEATELSHALPVRLNTVNDVIIGKHGEDDELTAKPVLTAATARVSTLQPIADAWNSAGITAYNLVTPLPDAKVAMEIEGKPFLVTGNFGSGKTAAFTGFTPVAGFGAHWTEDERLSANPSTRALFLTAATLLSEVSSRQPSSPELLLEQRIKPLFETLKSQSTTSVSLSLIPAEAKPNRDNFETRFPVRVRNQGSYAHGVHLYLQWNKSGAPYFADLSDNDFDLLPGEERVITIWTRSENNHPAINGTLHVSGPNISPSEVPVAVAVRTDN